MVALTPEKRKELKGLIGKRVEGPNSHARKRRVRGVVINITEGLGQRVPAQVVIREDGTGWVSTIRLEEVEVL